MSKGGRRKAWVAMANRKRNPEGWFAGPVAVTKVKKNRVAAMLPKRRGERGRDA
jgi:hypothetical protein